MNTLESVPLAPAAANELASASSAVLDDRLDWSCVATLGGMHLGCLGVFWTGSSPTAVGLAITFYLIRAFGLTAFYHRYFAHRSFRTSRWFQFVGATAGCLALQKGPLWWAAHHREHHRRSDREGDVHSPYVSGILWSHLGWFLTTRNGLLRSKFVRDWLTFPELRILDRFAPYVALGYGVTVYFVGEGLNALWPSLNTNGLQLVIWCFFLSTVALYHATYSVNSLAHLIGSRRFATADRSRNNLVIALLTLGEGWHNNHHHYPSAARQGFYWWEIDVTYYALLSFERVGLIWNVRTVPEHVYRAAGNHNPFTV